MHPAAIRPYDDALDRGTGDDLALRTDDGRVVGLDLARWRASADPVDLTVLARTTGSLLDVGCGPGRLVAAAAAEGRHALGIDVSQAAVAHAVARGRRAVRRDVFGAVPGAGRWQTAVLLDGNIGIGGDPARLYRRVRSLVAPGGAVVVETDPRPGRDERLAVRFAVRGQSVGPAFPWALVGSDAVDRLVVEHRDAVVGRWGAGGRTFVLVHVLGAGPHRVDRGRP